MAAGAAQRQSSEVDLGARGDHVDAVVPVAAGRGDRRIVIAETAVVEEEADIVGRDPGQAGLETVLGPARDTVRIEVEEIVAQVELDRAEAAPDSIGRRTVVRSQRAPR